MPYDGEIRNNRLSNPAKILAAYMRCSGITDAKQLAADLDIPVRTIQRLKMECAISGASDAVSTHANDAISGVSESATCAKRAMDGATDAAKCAISGVSRVEDNKYNNILTKTKTPGVTREAFAIDKAGKVAKSARAQIRIRGELDGGHGVLFDDGKLTISDGVVAELRIDFPSVDFAAVCDKAAPDIAKLSYPSKADAMASLRKWARIEVQNAAKFGVTIMPNAETPQARLARLGKELGYVE
jgi:hypothetical protein